MRKIYLLPNFITTFGIACGLFVIFKVNLSTSEAGTYELLHSSALLLLLAGLADFADGAVARIIRAESEFGVMFDSLADTISFGVAPAVLFLKTLQPRSGSWVAFFAVAGAMFYTFCGVLRLVRFNVRVQEARSDAAAASAHKKNFTGLPIPMGAAGAVSVPLLFHSPLFTSFFSPLSEGVNAVILIGVMIVMGALMVSKWRFPSLKALRIRVPSLYLIIFTALFTGFVLYGILHCFSVVLLVGSFGYILSGCTLTITRLIAGKKSETLVDFEPEVDEQDEEG
ncbi:MAG: CDP-alcohol phosphatidyltransferase family protein [Simkaniaceae bacterium]|nr:CDP-alcohol phosphatidyltransferase family protein [Simkaniaceae bacterium]